MSKRSKDLPSPLAAASREFGAWRKTRTKRRIPEGLWNRAKALAKRFGVHRTSRALGLNYADLKIRAASAEAEGQTSTSRFVELSPGSGAPCCCVEVDYPDGVKLRLQLNSAREESLLALERVIWRARA